MNHSEQDSKHDQPFNTMWILYIVAAFIAIIFSLYYYSQSLIRVEAPKQELGEKVIITLPEGETIFTYENLILEEKGKLLYKGERNMIDFTGGEVVYENWE